MMLTTLADIVRGAGLTVVEVDGWKTRGHGALVDVKTVVCHHTATPATARGDYPSLAVVRDGRSDLAGPLCNLGLSRTGVVYVVAAGVAYHAGVVLDPSYGNTHSIGIEAENPGDGSPWPAAQVDAYARLCAALVKGYGLTVARVLGHKEVCSPKGRKDDPDFDMVAFRAAVTRYVNGALTVALTADDVKSVWTSQDLNPMAGGTSPSDNPAEALLHILSRMATLQAAVDALTARPAVSLSDAQVQALATQIAAEVGKGGGGLSADDVARAVASVLTRGTTAVG
jgi:hypothetical protein